MITKQYYIYQMTLNENLNLTKIFVFSGSGEKITRGGDPQKSKIFGDWFSKRTYIKNYPRRARSAQNTPFKIKLKIKLKSN